MWGVSYAKDIILNNLDKKFLVYFDPDVDGAFAGVLPWKFLQNKDCSVDVCMNKNRQHGVIRKFKGNENYGVIISVDSFVPFEKVKELVDLGFNFISIDHHECGDEKIIYEGKNSCRGIVINNQYPWEREDKRYLSGAGVVFEVFCQMFPEEDFSWFGDVVGVTLLSDVRDISSEDAKGYLKRTFSAHKKNKYVQYLIDECDRFKVSYSFGRNHFDRSFISFTLSPTINSLLRFNYVKEVIDFVTGKGLRKYANKAQKELIEKTLKDHVELVNLNGTAIVKVEDWVKDVEMSNFIGLIANNLLSNEYKNVVCYVKSKKGISRASFRSINQGYDFLSKFKEAGYNAIGHKNAFGILDFVDKRVNVGWFRGLCDESSEVDLKRSYIEVRNMLTFKNSGRALQIAKSNDLGMDKDRVFVKYVGNNLKVDKYADNYVRLRYDNEVVMLFDVEVQGYSDYLVDVSTSNGVVNFVLTSYKE